MGAPELNRRLTSLDASFLYLENERAPLHIGATTILEGELDVEAVKRDLVSKMHLIPRYRQHVVFAPYNIGHPTWEDDPDFDINNHVVPVRLAAPGSEAQLRRVAAKLFAGMMDRSKPLWKVYIVQGLENGNTAVVWLVHHCMVDGVSGAELLSVILDPTPDPKPIESPPYEPVPAPDSSKVLVDALWGNVVDQLQNATELQNNLLNYAKGFRGSQLVDAMRELPGVLRDLLKPVPRLPFNSRSLSGKRKLSWSACSFADARGIRSELGGTVNDVILTALGGAVRRYMTLHGKRIRKRDTLRVMVPVSVRREDERGALGNRVSILPVDVPLGIEDPVERMKAVTERTSVLKKHRVADGLNLFMHAWAGTLPPVQAALGGAVFAAPLQGVLGLAMPSPGLHMVCTNVPGPQIPLYMLGNRMLAHYPLVPVAPGMGLNMAVFSYNQRIHFGFVADSAAAPDAARFNKFFDQCFIELREAAGVHQSEIIEIAARKLPKKAAPKRASGESNGTSTDTGSDTPKSQSLAG